MSVSIAPIHRGLADAAAVHDLLDDAFDGWGSRRLFEWKYRQYPGFDPAEHCYRIESDGIIGFRRVFEKDLRVDGTTHPVHVFGDTAVGAAHRGNGYYSDLREETRRYVNEVDSRATLAYNRKGGVTYDANRRRGWDAHDLPLSLLVHSYETVLRVYASEVLETDSILGTGLGGAGQLIELQTPGGRFPVSAVMDGTASADTSGVTINTEHEAITRLIECVTRGDPIEIGRSVLRHVVSGELSIVGTPSEVSYRPLDDGVRVISATAVDTPMMDTMVDLFSLTRAGMTAFRREEPDVQHLLAYPDAEVVLVEAAGGLRGFAVVGPHENGQVHEARVLELVAPSRGIFDMLCRAIETYTSEKGFDLVVMISEIDPGPAWARIDRQAVLWNVVGKGTIKGAMPPLVRMYDVV